MPDYCRYSDLPVETCAHCRGHQPGRTVRRSFPARFPGACGGGCGHDVVPGDRVCHVDAGTGSTVAHERCTS